ncbi:MAG: helix-turn-helix transcriptional regulator [Bacteroidetes bacterium]|nr:helix-turn-helix transcriptional regulator [Bacteroidota bacterium]
MATQFGERIRELRTKQNLLLRQLASQLDVDTSIISKVERGDRQLKKEQIPLLAQILKADVEELQTLWLADQLNSSFPFRRYDFHQRKRWDTYLYRY